MQTSTNKLTSMQISLNNHQYVIDAKADHLLLTIVNIHTSIYLDIKLFIDQLQFSWNNLSWPSI